MHDVGVERWLEVLLELSGGQVGLIHPSFDLAESGVEIGPTPITPTPRAALPIEVRIAVVGTSCDYR